LKKKFNKKQKKALRILLNHKNGVNELLYGGAAGGGKTWLGCSFALYLCLNYPGIRFLIGRARLSILEQTTLNTLYAVLKDWGLNEGTDYNYNGKSHELKLSNGSIIIMKDLFLYPKDPDFDNLGGLEITASFVDESNQVVEKAITVLKTRHRWMLNYYCGINGCNGETSKSKVLERDENNEPIKWKCHQCGNDTEGFIPKMLLSCNPAKNWVYSKFYKPWTEDKLEAFRQFIQATSNDNTKLTKAYKNVLDQLDHMSRKRLRDGDWDNESADALFKMDKIAVLWGRELPCESETHYIAIDPAGTGGDAAEIIVISGSKVVKEWITIPKAKKPSEIIEVVERLQRKWGVDEYGIAYDVDGLGWGLNDAFEYGYQIFNNGTPIENKVFQNLKAELYFKLSQVIEDEELSISAECQTLEIQEELTREMQVIEEVEIDKDGKRKITPKNVIKQTIGRSPNKADVLAYAMRFFLDESDSSYIILD